MNQYTVTRDKLARLIYIMALPTTMAVVMVGLAVAL